MENITIEKIVNISPNIGIVQRAMSCVRVRRVKSHFIDKNEILLGEKNITEKKRIVDKYSDKWNTYLGDTIELCDKVLRSSREYMNRNNLDEIRVDMIFCRLAYGFRPDEYLCFNLEKQSATERKTWVSDLDRYLAIYRMNNLKSAQTLNNKARTFELFGQFYGRDAISIKTDSDFDKFEAFVQTHPVFVKKQVLEGFGKSIELIDITKIRGDTREYFQKLIHDGEHILEEKIKQSKEMSVFHSSSVNTVRCITFRTKSGVIAPFTFMKTGRDGSFIDNGGAGGILIGVNQNTGILNTDGYDENNVRYIRHPNSDIVFKGYQLPEWEKMIALCKKISEILPGAQCIGWDLAYTDKGWIVVEGNGHTQFIVPQIVYRKGIKKELNKIMSNMDLFVSLD